MSIDFLKLSNTGLDKEGLSDWAAEREQKESIEGKTAHDKRHEMY